ncbi:hypothetical protein CES07_23230 [Salmonella enterica subsp. enterica serovar Newport]|uniref:hypothetical protein n=1 Tax=Escherichia coli TaxID=562 RepID=UPI0012D6D797|nr:hypothetical protein [Escherichia coli]EDI5389713.1 hypothetical protein [Salmonella enterica subsp. enterica serovar Newport]EKZ8381495.1 hypothetical protein [Salmonella enterica subsp. enterica serovar Worthington]ELG7337688.1 hypothetical protein [Salmonella enterica subsp. enterica serovar Worthington]MCJ1026630.1 hypothetical protein [Escherichia coli]
MTIRNAFFSMIVAVAAVSAPVANAADAATHAAVAVDAAYSFYNHEAEKLAFQLDAVGADLKEAASLSPAEAEKMQTRIALIRARQDAALGRFLVEAARAQAKQAQ